MHLQENPPAPCHLADLSFRYHGDPNLHASTLFNEPFLNQPVRRRTAERNVAACRQLLNGRALRKEPFSPQRLLNGEAALACFRSHLFYQALTLLDLFLEPLISHGLQADLTAFTVRERCLPRDLSHTKPAKLRTFLDGDVHRRAQLRSCQPSFFAAASGQPAARVIVHPHSCTQDYDLDLVWPRPPAHQQKPLTARGFLLIKRQPAASSPSIQGRLAQLCACDDGLQELRRRRSFLWSARHRQAGHVSQEGKAHAHTRDILIQTLACFPKPMPFSSRHLAAVLHGL